MSRTFLLSIAAAALSMASAHASSVQSADCQASTLATARAAIKAQYDGKCDASQAPTLLDTMPFSAGTTFDYSLTAPCADGNVDYINAEVRVDASCTTQTGTLAPNVSYYSSSDER